MQISNSKPLIITGHSLGGSVASLFTLWLLDKINLANTKRPLCVTFESPLIGDGGLQKAILQYLAWNSCFLHVVSDQDSAPRVLIPLHNPAAPESTSPANEYKPFGKFLLCSELGCACLEDHESILAMLVATYTKGPGNQDCEFFDYGNIVQQLDRQVICKDSTKFDEWIAQPAQAGIATQLAAIGLGRPQQLQQQRIDMNTLVRETEKQERKWLIKRRPEVSDSNVLNEMEVYVAQLEWYKKCSEDKGIGYYDSFKNASDRSDIVAEKYKNVLKCYWIDKVEEVEKKPQWKNAAFTTRWLYAGTNYRRMIEPLDIAKYYRQGKTDDKTKGRSKHYKQERSKHYKLLEQWLEEDEKHASLPNNLKKQNLTVGLTEDSCFWANVEEALISCEVLTKRKSNDMDKHKQSLIEFEAYVWGMLKNNAVSHEIFLKWSSFMQWWEEYLKIIRKGIMGTSYTSPLTDFMKKAQFRQYTSQIG